MLYSIIIAQAAEEDLRQAYFWYEEQKERLGSLFEKQIVKAFESIEHNPLKTQIRYDDVRVFFLKKFPFGIHFRVCGAEILVIAVFHTSQSPEAWGKRNTKKE